MPGSGDEGKKKSGAGHRNMAVMGQESGTGIWLAPFLNLIPGSWFLREFLNLGTLGY